MSSGWERRRRRPGETVKEGRPVSDIVRDMKNALPRSSYREQSLRIHGLICARCGREFDEKNRHLLTVHHRDGNHHNNPPDGSNWENLCTYCHDDTHSRGRLGHYLSGGEEGKGGGGRS